MNSRARATGRITVTGLVTGLAAFAMSACTDLSIPADTEVLCDTDGSCPGGRVCAKSIGRCVDPELLAGDAIAFDERPEVSVSVLSREPGHSEGLVSFSFLDVGPEALSVTFDDPRTAVDCPAAKRDVREYSCTFTVGADSEEGSHELEVDALDAVGNEVSDTVRVVYDFTPPQVLTDPTTAYKPADNNLGALRTAIARDDTEVTVLLTLDDIAIVHGVAVVGATGPTPFESVTDAAGILEIVLPPPLTDAPEGANDLELDLEDGAGNRGLTRVPGAFQLDRTPPVPQLDTETPGNVRLERAPWGDIAADGSRIAPYARVVLADGLVPEPDTLLRVETEAGLVLGLRYESDPANEPGYFADLLVADVSTAFAVLVDGAGNASGPARVLDVRWTATLADKVPGDTFANPHALLSTPLFRGRLELATTPEVDPADARSADATAVTGTGTAQWEPLAVPTFVPAVSGAATWIDSARGALVVFGGNGEGGTASGQTAELDIDDPGASWVPVSGVGPSPRAGAAGAYHPLRNAGVVFGGRTDEDLSETWLFRDGAWAPLPAPPPGQEEPSPRANAALAYDAARGVLVLHGGTANGNQPLNDTWELAATGGWRAIDVTGPPARERGALGFDEERGVVVLHGGTGEGVGNDVWTYDGLAWSALTTTGSPTFSEHALAFHRGRGALLLFGGLAVPNDPAGLRAELWALNQDDTWTPIALPLALVPRARAALAQDAVTGEVWLTFGESGGRVAPPFPLSDTWRVGAADIVERAIAKSEDLIIEPRSGAAIAWEAASARFLLFGGTSTGPTALDALHSDTWSFDGQRFARLHDDGEPIPGVPGVAPRGAMIVAGAGTITLFGAVSGPPTTGFAWDAALAQWVDGPDAEFDAFLVPRAAYDSAHDEVVLVNAAATGLETWTSTGGGDLTVACAPPALCPGATAHVAYDAIREVIVAVSNGGGVASPADDGTYEWDGAAWTRVADLPVPGVEHELVFHSWRNAVVAFPTRDAGDQWELGADHTWSPVPVRNPPPPRDGATIGMNEETGELWSIGGSPALNVDTGNAWRLPMASPPALIFKTVLAAAGRGGAPLKSLRVRAYAGATSFGPVGANLLAWERGRFEVLASNSVKANELDGAAPFDVTITDADLLTQLPVGNEDALFVAVTPKSGLELAGVTSDIALDAIAVTVEYRLE